jgi:hypothetical protein
MLLRVSMLLVGAPHDVPQLAKYAFHPPAVHGIHLERHSLLLGELPAGHSHPPVGDVSQGWVSLEGADDRFQYRPRGEQRHVL